MTIREIVIARAAELNLTAHALALRPGIEIGRTTLHRYFAGQADLTGEKLGRLLAELGLEIVVKKLRKNCRIVLTSAGSGTIVLADKTSDTSSTDPAGPGCWRRQ